MSCTFMHDPMFLPGPARSCMSLHVTLSEWVKGVLGIGQESPSVVDSKLHLSKNFYLHNTSYLFVPLKETCPRKVLNFSHV